MSDSDLDVGLRMVTISDELLADARRKMPDGSHMVVLAAALAKAVAQDVPVRRQEEVLAQMQQLLGAYYASCVGWSRTRDAHA